MADIIDVMQDDCAHIACWQVKFSELGRHHSDPGSRQGQAVWRTLASLIELHLSAEDEICGPAICRAGPDGPARVRSMLDEHEDLRELIREARLQPPGSSLWWQLTTATLAAWARQLGREEHGILDGLRRAGPALRQQLARQWRAFTEARLRDQGQQKEAYDAAAWRLPLPRRQDSSAGGQSRPGVGGIRGAGLRALGRAVRQVTLRPGLAMLAGGLRGAVAHLGRLVVNTGRMLIRRDPFALVPLAL